MKNFFLFVCFSILAISNFSIKNGKVFYENKYGKEIVKKADSKTFEILPRKDFAKDKNHVYVGSYAIPGADPETFELLSYCYSKDKNNVYCTDGKLNGLNPNTFKIIGDYAYDNEIMYFGFLKFKKVDIESFEILESLYSRDKNSIYYASDEIKGADNKTFEAFKNGYARDKNHIYLFGKIQEELNPQTFEIPEKSSVIIHGTAK